MRKTYGLAGELLYLVRKELGFGVLSLTIKEPCVVHFEWRVKKNFQWWACLRDFDPRLLDPDTIESFARHLAMDMRESCRKSA